ELEGDDVTSLDRTARADLRRAKIAYVGQQAGLVPHLSALENVELVLALRGLGGGSPAAFAALESVGLGERPPPPLPRRPLRARPAGARRPGPRGARRPPPGPRGGERDGGRDPPGAPRGGGRRGCRLRAPRPARDRAGGDPDRPRLGVPPASLPAPPPTAT